MTNKTILISGSSAGLGLACARLFSNSGWNVLATMRNPQQCSELEDSQRLLKVAMDVTDKHSIERAIEKGLARFGSIDVLFNNAGYGSFSLFEENSEENFRAMFETNFFGHLNVMRAVLPVMRQQQGGSVINVTSLAGRYGFPLQGSYCASKFAFAGFSEAISWELQSQGISTTIFELGAMNSEFASHMQNQRDQPIADYNSYMQRMLDNLKVAIEKFIKTASSPEKVALQALKLANMETKPLRFHPTPDGKIMNIMRRLVSESRFRKISTMGLND